MENQFPYGDRNSRNYYSLEGNLMSILNMDYLYFVEMELKHINNQKLEEDLNTS